MKSSDETNDINTHHGESWIIVGEEATDTEPGVHWLMSEQAARDLAVQLARKRPGEHFVVMKSVVTIWS
jgi:hypothetical protein